MRAIADIGLIVITGASLTVAARLTPGETSSTGHERQLVVLPTSSNADALQLASHGIAELTTDDGLAISTLHVRAVIANTARAPWAIDASKARLEALSGTLVAPAVVNSDLRTLPVAIIDPGERRTLDLYFPLPSELVDLGPATFAVSWPVDAPTRIVQYAWFERDVAIAKSAREPWLAAGWGAYWWFDPKYPWSAYVRRDGIITPRPPNHVMVTKAPRWDEPSTRADDPQPRETECVQW